MPKKKNDGFINLTATFHLVASISSGCDIDNFLTKETEWIGEPTSPNGCVVSMNLKEWFETKGGKGDSAQKETTKKETRTPNNQQIKFSFRGTKFVIDTKEAIVRCDSLPFDRECNTDKEALYELKSEVS